MIQGPLMFLVKQSGTLIQESSQNTGKKTERKELQKIIKPPIPTPLTSQQIKLLFCLKMSATASQKQGGQIVNRLVNPNGLFRSVIQIELNRGS